MTIVLNEVAKRERPLPKPKKVHGDLLAYLQERCPNLNMYIEVRDALYAAEEDGTAINWQASNIDNAMTWADTPQGDEYWSNIHGKLEYGDD